MWNASSGECVLKGKEAKVFAQSLLNLVEQIEVPNNSVEFGIRVFDELTYNQRISILWLITNCLFREDVPCVELTALNEGAIAAVFENLRQELCFEIEEMPKRKCWRKLIRSALIELDYEDEPPLKCNDVDKWLTAVDWLSGLILWDNDYLMDEILDDPPEISRSIKELSGINGDYYNDIADDPNEAATEKSLFQMKEILNKVLK